MQTACWQARITIALELGEHWALGARRFSSPLSRAALISIAPKPRNGLNEQTSIGVADERSENPSRDLFSARAAWRFNGKVRPDRDRRRFWPFASILLWPFSRPCHGPDRRSPTRQTIEIPSTRHDQPLGSTWPTTLFLRACVQFRLRVFFPFGPPLRQVVGLFGSDVKFNQPV